MRMPVSMASICLLPDGIVELIAWHVISKEDGAKNWCRLASTCSRFWRLQLPGADLCWNPPGDTKLEAGCMMPSILDC